MMYLANMTYSNHDEQHRQLAPKCSLITAMNRWGLSNLFLLLPFAWTQREITQPYQEETDEGDNSQLPPIPCSPQVVNGVTGFVCDGSFCSPFNTKSSHCLLQQPCDQLLSWSPCMLNTKTEGFLKILKILKFLWLLYQAPLPQPRPLGHFSLHGLPYVMPWSPSSMIHHPL